MADKKPCKQQAPPLHALHLAYVQQRTGDLFPTALRKSYAV